MKKLLLTIIVIIFSMDSFALGLIPSVNSYIPLNQEWKIPSKIMVYTPHKDPFYMDFLEDKLFANRVVLSSDISKSDIQFILDSSVKREGYHLNISKDGVKVSASCEIGMLYALQSFEQLIYGDKDNKIAGCEIFDQPRCGFRSFMLDSGRQYQSVETIKKYLDMMLSLKMNTFHWHLTEGRGWRIEIKKYPNLAISGSQVADGDEQQGYYTQEEIKELVEYAAERNITIMPEIDMPAHAEAALSVYPEYSCFGERPTIPEKGFTKEIFCVGKESTLSFLRDILDEVCDLFPSEYIHIGGDEAPKGNWDVCPDCQRVIRDENLKDSDDLQRWFSNEMVSYLGTKGRKGVLYCDVLVGDEGYKLSENSAIFWWNYKKRVDMPLTKSLKEGYEIICGTNYYTYLNFPVSPWSGYTMSRTFDMRDVYERNPSYVREENPLILGMSCAMWTDYNVCENMIDQRLFPRILAISEQMWREKPLEEYENFYNRVKFLKPMFEDKGYEFGPAHREDVPVDYKWD